MYFICDNAILPITVCSLLTLESVCLHLNHSNKDAMNGVHKSSSIMQCALLLCAQLPSYINWADWFFYILRECYTCFILVHQCCAVVFVHTLLFTFAMFRDQLELNVWRSHYSPLYLSQWVCFSRMNLSNLCKQACVRVFVCVCVFAHFSPFAIAGHYISLSIC